MASAESLADELQRRGYDVLIGPRSDGLACDILANPDGQQVGLSVYFVENGVIRWQAGHGGPLIAKHSRIDTVKLADLVIESI